MDNLFLQTGIHTVSPSISISASNPTSTALSAVSRHNGPKSSAVTPPPPLSSSKFSFRLPFISLWPKCKTQRQNGLALEDDAVLVDAEDQQKEEEEEGREKNLNVNWVMKILHVRSLWKNQKQGEDDSVVDNDDGDVCRVDYDDDDGEDEEREIEFDRESFSRMLRRVSLADAKLYAKMTHLSNLAYSIPSIQPGNLLTTQGLRFVTSSIEKRELAAISERCQVPAESQDVGRGPKDEVDDEQPHTGSQKNPSVAYQIAASAASYLQSHTKSLLRFRSSNSEAGDDGPKDTREEISSFDITKTDVSNLKATTESVTAVVAAKEEVKQAVADDLSSNKSSPCEWFICDDDQTGTRFFAIQGSESLASWKANLLFEPINFEGMDVLVHRGIYEAAKGIYEQMLPEIRSHMHSRKHAIFRFTGHSLGGSLAVLVSLMLLLRNEVPASSILPVITFGSPSIMCGGDKLLHKLGLPKGHVQAIVMHRDIVPRAFSCQYPNHVAGFLKALNRNFCNHPCLNTQKLLYTPMGELLILQPDAKLSPRHGLLPLDSGLYHLSGPLSDPTSTEKLLRAAQMVFFNSPHPLEILSDRNAYGSGGTIQRNHDMKSYLKSVRDVICQDLKRMRKTGRERTRKVWWSHVIPNDVDIGIVVGRSVVSSNIGQEQFRFSGILQNGKNSLKRFSRLVASQHMHMLVVLLIPARTLLLDAYNVINFH